MAQQRPQSKTCEAQQVTAIGRSSTLIAPSHGNPLQSQPSPLRQQMDISGAESMLRSGITLNHQVMLNGETRSRLYHPDGSAYIRTDSPREGAWQNSHYHSSIRECYIVQEGRMVFAELITEGGNRTVKFTLLHKNDVCFSNPGTPHNVFLFGDSAIHTVKYGEIAEKDWVASGELDRLTKHLSEEKLLEICI